MIEGMNHHLVYRLEQRIAMLESRCEKLESRNNNGTTRGVVKKQYDEHPIQRQMIDGYVSEELDQVQSWQQFGFASVCPVGGDVLMTALGSNRDGAQITHATHKDYRPRQRPEGTTVVHSMANNYAMWKPGGDIIIYSPTKITFYAPEIEFFSDTLTHNTVDVSENHVHEGVMSGSSKTEKPVGGGVGISDPTGGEIVTGAG